MKIAQVSPLYESVPPRLYGGTERVVSYLTEELVRQGHSVTLFASGDSTTEAELRAICQRSLRLQGNGPLTAPLAHHLLLVERVMQQAHEFDVIHFHLDYLPFSQIRRNNIPAVTTLHGRLDISDLFPLFSEFKDMNLVSISDAQRTPMTWASWLGTVHHGLPENLYAQCERPGNYLAFLGRISPEKRVDRAIKIARRVGMPLRIAAKVDAADQEYFVEHVQGLLSEPYVEFLGEIGEEEKSDFLGNARALLFPIDWPEPFGLVMIEAMACGTPVIAFRNGSVPEILQDGVNGFIVDSVEEAVSAARRVSTISRSCCRAVFEERFSARRMCQDYVRIYEHILSDRKRLAREKYGGSLSVRPEEPPIHAAATE